MSTIATKFVTNEEVSAFLEAALNGDTVEVSTMLNRKWYLVDAPSENDETALMLATWNGNVDTVDMLCQHNASTFATNEDDENVFDQVCEDDTKRKQLDQVLQRARNEEIDSWNISDGSSRVQYVKDADNDGIWCIYKSDFGSDFEENEHTDTDDEMTRSGYEMAVC